MRKYFVTGLLILVPLAITLWVLNLIITTMDRSLLLLPAAWQPETFLHLRVPGMGVLLTLLIVFLTGVAARNFIGKRVLRLWESVLIRIPVVNSIYSSVKQVSDTLLSSSGNAFRKAVLVPYPHQNSWTIAFLTGAPGGDVKNHLEGDFISVYVPTTPNPTSGFMLLVPKDRVYETRLSIEEAMKLIISGGLVKPGYEHPPANTVFEDFTIPH